MKTGKIIKETDELLAKIQKQRKKEKFAESLEFELRLIDDLLREIKKTNKKRLHENPLAGLGNFLQKIVGTFADFLGAGLREVLGISEERYNSSRSSAA